MARKSDESHSSGRSGNLPVGVEQAIRMRTEKVVPGRTRVIRENPIRLGKDELNLVEHPFAVLWQKEAGEAVIYYEWDAKHPVSGKLLPASWRVTGDPQHGLPNASDERVYLVLMELTREAEFEGPTVHFSRYDIIKRLGWPNTARSYKMLQAAFDRLKGVTIYAKNAFWNPKSRTFRNTAFDLIDLYDISAEPPGRKSGQTRELPLSYFKWSDVIFDSFQNGYIRSLDLDFALALRSDIALRLYRYLDKKAYDGREKFEIELFNLCVGHLGMKPSPHPSKLKERLQPAHAELIERGFLSGVDYEAMKSRRSVKVRYAFAKRMMPLPDALPSTMAEMDSHALLTQNAIDEEPEESTSVQTLQDIAQSSLFATSATAEKTENTVESANGAEEDAQELKQRMLDIKVSPEVANDLLATISKSVLHLQLECLEDREARDPAAVFVKAARGNWEAPAQYLARINAQERAEKAQIEKTTSRTRQAAQEAKERTEKAHREHEETQLDATWEKLDASTRERIETQARERLGVLGRSGRSSGALVAMRRNLLRELLGNPEISN